MGKSGNVENLLESLLQKIDFIAYICVVLWDGKEIENEEWDASSYVSDRYMAKPMLCCVGNWCI